MLNTNGVIEKHVRNYFQGHDVSARVWTAGPILQELPRFRVLHAAPGPRTNLHVYVSVGAWEAQEDRSLEFTLISPEATERCVELLAMNAHYHLKNSLGAGHTLPVGEPWLAGSTCEFMLISKPYPFGLEFEICPTGTGHVHIYWLLPITESERKYKMEHGLEALEEKFDEHRLEYWQVGRASVV